MSTGTEPFWRAAGESVTGALHLRRQQPNQDSLAIGHMRGAYIVAAADGHGSTRCFRSDRGSRLATRHVVAVLKEALAGEPSDLSRRLREQVPGELVRRWKQAVAADIRQNPFVPQELNRLAEKSRSAMDEVVLDPALAYGSTLLAALATEEFVFYLQLGDGDILAVAEDGTVSRPMPRDPNLIANETTSLCMREAARHVHVRLEIAAPRLPALVMVSTDGYANSYDSDAKFLHVGRDYVRLIQDEGFDAVAGKLKGWLSEVTADASGDDITVGLLFRPSALAPQRPLSRRRPSEEETLPDPHPDPDHHTRLDREDTPGETEPDGQDEETAWERAASGSGEETAWEDAGSGSGAPPRPGRRRPAGRCAGPRCAGTESRQPMAEGEGARPDVGSAAADVVSGRGSDQGTEARHLSIPSTPDERSRGGDSPEAPETISGEAVARAEGGEPVELAPEPSVGVEEEDRAAEDGPSSPPSGVNPPLPYRPHRYFGKLYEERPPRKLRLPWKRGGDE